MVLFLATLTDLFKYILRLIYVYTSPYLCDHKHHMYISSAFTFNSSPPKKSTSPCAPLCFKVNIHLRWKSLHGIQRKGDLLSSFRQDTEGQRKQVQASNWQQNRQNAMEISPHKIPWGLISLPTFLVDL